MATTTAVTLVTIPFSHFCEKARWALDHHGVSYVEEAHAPGAHILPMRRRGARSVPILIDGDQVIADSTAILQHLDRRAPEGRRLYPSNPAMRREVEELEDELDEQLGVFGRQWAYFHLLRDTRAAIRLMTYGMGPLGRAAFIAVFPAIRALIRRKLDVHATTVAIAMERVRAVLARVGARLADGRRYLVGDRLTAADLAFASLSGPVLGLPPDAPWLRAMPASMQAGIDELRRTPAAEFALRLYREDRRSQR